MDEAVQELKENEFKELFTKDLSSVVDLRLPDCQIETDLQIIIPETYVSNISERLSLYNQLDNIEKEEELQEFQKSMVDRSYQCPKKLKIYSKLPESAGKQNRLDLKN